MVMTEQIRDIYRVTSAQADPALVVEMNRVLQRVSDRFDRLEGLRGTPTFYSDTIQTPSGRLALTQNAWPVGSIFIAAVATSPSALLGFGTWEAFGTGKVLVGIDSTDEDFSELEGTGGEKSHTHTVDVESTTSGAPSATENITAGAVAVASATHTHAVDPAEVESSEADNLMPYIVVYMWKRTA
jgi:hypothetical protein